MTETISPPPIQKGPSLMRYDRVTAILEAEPVFKERLGPKNQEIVRRAEKRSYSKMVVDVTHLIHAKNLDASNVPKNVVLRLASEVCDLLKRSPVANGAAAAPAPAPVTVAPVLVDKPKQAPKQKAPPKAPKPAKAVAKETVPAAPAPAKVSPPAPAKASAPAMSQAPVPELVDNENTLVVVYSNIAKLSMLVSLSNLMQIDDDKFPGFEKRREALEFLIKDYARIKAMPSQIQMLSNGKS